MSECKDDQERSEIKGAMDASKKALYHHTGKHVSVCLTCPTVTDPLLELPYNSWLHADAR